MDHTETMFAAELKAVEGVLELAVEDETDAQLVMLALNNRSADSSCEAVLIQYIKLQCKIVVFLLCDLSPVDVMQIELHMS